MGTLYSGLEQLIGATPLVQLNRFSKHMELQTPILAKLESFNPGGSAKDRVALAMILDAEARGILSPGGTVIEPTSGNTGIGLAAIASARGYRAIIVMPDSMSVERRLLMGAYGAQVVLTPGALGMAGSIEKAQALAREIPNSFIPDQFNNTANAMAHYRTTGPEIWKDSQGRLDIFVAGVGTGGTITGIGRFLKEQNPQIQVVAVEPATSPLLSQGHSGSHGLQGIGANFVPGILNRSVIDQILTVSEEDAYAAGRALIGTEGLLAGISSGAALHAAAQLARRPENVGKTIVTLLPDTGERYLSTAMFR